MYVFMYVIRASRCMTLQGRPYSFTCHVLISTPSVTQGKVVSNG